MKTKKIKIAFLPLFIAIIIPLIAGALSAYITSGDMNLYETMARPPLSPPGWLFPIVWTILYIIMGVASYIVYMADIDLVQKKKALTFYIIQLVMNMIWSTLFFTFRLYLFAYIWLMVMWLLIVICTIRFYKIRPCAGVMMIVLLLWTTFAAYLNLACFILSIA